MPRHDFEPDWVVHPGQLLRETLADHKLTQAWLASHTGYTAKHINVIVQGKAPITAEVAVVIAKALGKPRGWARTLARMQVDHDVSIAWEAHHASAT